MKTRMFASILILVLLFVVSVSFAEDKTPVDQFFGTWVNEDYNEVRMQWEKVTLNPDGTFDYYNNSNDTKPFMSGTFILKDSWIDSEGNLWILEDEYVGTYFEGKKVSEYLINKISKSGTTLECISNNQKIGRHPEEKDLNPNDSSYRVYYRQE